MENYKYECHISTRSSEYAFNFLIESSKLFHNASKRIFNLFQSSLASSSVEVEEQSQNSNNTDNQRALFQVKSSPTKDSKISSIVLNTEVTKLSFKCHPKTNRIVSEKAFRKYSLCNIISGHQSTKFVSIETVEISYKQSQINE